MSSICRLNTQVHGDNSLQKFRYQNGLLFRLMCKILMDCSLMWNIYSLLMLSY